jgi:hypothetical protein
MRHEDGKREGKMTEMESIWAAGGCRRRKL